MTFGLAVTAAACRTPRSSEDSLSTLREAGEDKVSACSPKRSILDPKEGFDFSARNLSLRDAYWLALLAADAYAKKDVVLPELARLGFKDAVFFDEDQVSKNFLNTGLDFPWASTQGFWAEAPGGVVLSFRGSFPGELADLVSDAWSTPSRLEVIGSQIVGTITDTAAAAAAQLPGATIKLEAGENVLVHKGFWNALLIVWKHLETKATKLYAAERPKERATKMALLDGWAKTLKDKGQEPALQALRQETDWRIDEAGKLNFLKQWNLATSEKKRLDLFEFLDANWASKQRPIFLTGHSLGGALATLTAYRLMKMGLNVRGLYTYGAPRVGNQAFVHEFRVLAWQKGLKARGTLSASGNGGMQRFVHHLDVVTRVPPAFGFVAGLSPEDQAEEASGWAHVSAMNYIPSAAESKQLTLWREGEAEFEEHFEGTSIPRFVSTLPVEKWREWGGDHATTHYIPKLEQLAFGKATPCK